MKIANRDFDFDNNIYVMGIVNVTPDSFSDGGKYVKTEEAVKHALKLIEDGADIIDVGGESTRPGSSRVCADEEISRVIPVIEGVRKVSDIPISVDTYKPEVALNALKSGANIINDVNGLVDGNMAKVAGSYEYVIAMHNPKPFGFDCVNAKKRVQVETDGGFDAAMASDYFMDKFLGEMKEIALRAKTEGIEKNRLMLDPGIGFFKNHEENITILRNLSKIRELGFPILLGCSKKRVIKETVGEDNLLAGTLATTAMAFWSGANVVRVHDVKENVTFLQMLKEGYGVKNGLYFN